ncbi:MAG: NADH-quinone oxidoreductase subunit H [Phycisphaerales bacterium]|nr:NADH-quinone oxidoreductase subunit H [Phycisphaerales bacterium]
MIDLIAHVLLLLLMPPLLLGVIVKTKAAFAGRVGAPLLQPYYDLIKLFQKGTVLSRTTTWVFLAGPTVTLFAVMVAGLLVPLSGRPAPLRFAGDFILFAYLLALGRFFTALAALDTGSSFEGMGASREVTFACLAEPALFLGLLALARLSGGLSLTALLGGQVGGAWIAAAPTMVLVVGGLFIILLVENSRIPFDDPNTHLELTMIHEVMVLDHGGPALGAVLYGAAVKLFVLSAVVARLMVPVASERPVIHWPVFVVSMLLVAVLIGVVESVMARLRLLHVPNLLLGACLLTGLGFILLLGSSS